jgi:hypothetical protein
MPLVLALCALQLAAARIHSVEGYTCENNVDIFYLVDSSTSIEKDSSILATFNSHYKEYIPPFNQSGYFDDNQSLTRSGASNFDAMIEAQKDFAFGKFAISQNGSRLGLAQFASNVFPYWSLADYTNKFQLEQAFDGLYWRAGATSTGEALAYAQQQLLSGPGARAGAHKLLFLVTDGEPSNKELALSQASEIIANGTYLFIMGYGPEVNQPSSKALLQQMVAGPIDLLTVSNVSEYSSQAYRDRIERDYKDHLCFGRPPPTTVPTNVPTAAPTGVPTDAPTSFSAAPTDVPTSAAPTDVPTNGPTAGPTGAPTLAPTADLSDPCLRKSLDLYFLLDTSTSIEIMPELSLFTDSNVSDGYYNGNTFKQPGYTKPTPNFTKVINILKNFTSRMGDAPMVKVGMAQWANYPIPEWSLLTYAGPGKRADLLGAFDRLKWRGGSTYADRAIEYGVQELEKDGTAVSHGHYQVLVLATDGVTSNFTKAKEAALKARNKGILIYVLGYGQELAVTGKRAEQMVELTGSTDTTKRYFYAEKSVDLMTAVNQAVDTMCGDLALSPTSSPTKAPSPQPESCTNGVEDGTESDVDCGGLICKKCAAGQKCESSSDCVFGPCKIRLDTLSNVCPSVAPTSSPTLAPSPAPTAAPTGTPTSTWHCPSVGKVDWFYLLDSSSSIEKDHLDNGRVVCSAENPLFTVDGYNGDTANFAAVVASLKQQISYLTIGPDAVQVGLAQFSTEPVPEWDMLNFSSADSKPALLAAFDKLRYRCGGTMTNEAIEYGQEQLASGAGHRVGANKVLCVVTDGVANNNEAAQLQASYAKGNGTIIYVIGYGDDVHSNVAANQALRQMATSEDYYFSADDASGIEMALDNATMHFCVTAFREPPIIHASCTNDKRDGTETDVDCGGPFCGACTVGSVCDTTADCLKAYLCVGQRCALAPSTAPSSAPTTETQFKCANGLHDGETESDIDCGGLCVKKCALGKNCESTDDCESESTDDYCNFQTHKCSPAPTLVGYVTSTTVSIGGFTKSTFELAKPSFITTVAALYNIQESNIVNLEVSDTTFITRSKMRMLGDEKIEKIYVRFDILSAMTSGATGAAAVAAVSGRVFANVDAFEKKFVETMVANNVNPPEGLTASTESVSIVQYTTPPTMGPTTRAPDLSFWEKEKQWLMPTILAFSGLVFVLLLAAVLCHGQRPRSAKQRSAKQRSAKQRSATLRSAKPAERESEAKAPVKGPQLVEALGRATSYTNHGNAYSPSNSASTPHISNDSIGIGASYSPGDQQHDPYRFYSNAQRSTTTPASSASRGGGRHNGEAIGNGARDQIGRSLVVYSNRELQASVSRGNDQTIDGSRALPPALQSQLLQIEEEEMRVLNQAAAAASYEQEQLRAQVRQSMSKDRTLSPGFYRAHNRSSPGAGAPLYEKNFRPSPRQ